MKIYKPDGYLNAEEILKTSYTFILIIGARGTGKTYNIGKALLVNRADQLVYMRRTKTEIDIAGSSEFNAFSAIAEDEGIDISFTPLKYGKKIVVNDEPRGYALPLSTFSNVRGINASAIKWIFFDEFIPEHERHYKINEADSFFQAYETLNRNRELNGEDPIRCILCANSNRLDNDFFQHLQLVNIISRLSKNGQEVYADPRRGLLVINLSASPISRRKAETALYRLTGGNSDFDRMALGNTYNDLTQYHVRSFNLKGFKPLWRIGELNIYRNADGVYYGTSHESGAPKVYEATDTGFERFAQERGGLLMAKYLKNKLWFESPAEEVIFRIICNF